MKIHELVADVGSMWNATEVAGSYSAAFMLVASRSLPHVRSNHAVMHLAKAAGKVVAALEPRDHGQSVDREELCKALADVFICAARIAGLEEINADCVVVRRLAAISSRGKPEDHA